MNFKQWFRDCLATRAGKIALALYWAAITALELGHFIFHWPLAGLAGLYTIAMVALFVGINEGRRVLHKRLMQEMRDEMAELIKNHPEVNLVEIRLAPPPDKWRN